MIMGKALENFLKLNASNKAKILEKMREMVGENNA
jgi:hypothetical protein